MGDWAGAEPEALVGTGVGAGVATGALTGDGAGLVAAGFGAGDAAGLGVGAGCLGAGVASESSSSESGIGMGKEAGNIGGFGTVAGLDAGFLPSNSLPWLFLPPSPSSYKLSLRL